MHIKEMISQHRRDFWAIFQCEYCCFEFTCRGYDDERFHKQVLPSWSCPDCDKKASSNYQPQPTKYPDGWQLIHDPDCPHCQQALGERI